MGSSQTTDTERNGQAVYAWKHLDKVIDFYKGEFANITPAESACPNPIYF